MTGKIDRDGQETGLNGLAKGAIFEKRMRERPSRQSHQSVPAIPERVPYMGKSDRIFNGTVEIGSPLVQVARMAVYSRVMGFRAGSDCLLAATL
jgi:hypothetical protein